MLINSVVRMKNVRKAERRKKCQFHNTVNRFCEAVCMCNIHVFCLMNTREQLECDLIFVGLLVLENRLKPETLPVIRTLKDAAIRTVMVTGWHWHGYLLLTIRFNKYIHYLRQQGGGYVIVLSFFLSFCKQDNWWTQKLTPTKLGRHGLGVTWPSRSGNFCWWSRSTCGFQMTFSFLHHCGIGDFFGHLLAFLVQLMADL